MRSLLIFIFACASIATQGQVPKTYNWHGDDYIVYPEPVYYYSGQSHPNYQFTFSDTLKDGQYVLFNDNERRNIDCLIGVKAKKITFVTYVSADGTSNTTNLITKSVIHYDKKHRKTVEYSLDYTQLKSAWDVDGKYMVKNGDGQFTFYHDNGQLKMSGFVQSGLFHGPSSSYHNNGKLSEQGQYQQGKKHGTWTFYDLNGKETRTEQWYYGSRKTVTE